MADNLNAWAVMYRLPQDTATGWSEWMQASHHPVLIVETIDGNDQVASGQEFDLGEARAQSHAVHILKTSNFQWEVSVDKVHRPSYDAKQGQTIEMVARFG